MVHYETLILSVPEITAQEAATIEEQMEKIIKKAGKINSFERWGKYRLAYPVHTNDYGVYFLARFQTEQKDTDVLLKEINDLFDLKFSQVVMRFMNTRLDEKNPFTYQKPDSLEDIPSQDVDTFLRENKMEGLIKSSGSSEGSTKERRASRKSEDMDELGIDKE